ncbi:MAG: tetratricopeptide repeat protein [Planctomycetaceae bacterium]|nr:tetratricopeptide repeat protein [Planctomycetaceae bacterium]
MTNAAVDETRQADFPAEIDFGVKNLSGNERTERQQDKLHAATLFAQGRMHYRRRNFEQSLQHFQRAWRYDRSVVSITNELIPLAISLKRDNVAARYAELALETGNLNPQALGRIAVLLAKSQRYNGAIEAYQTLLASKPKNRIDDSFIAIHVEIARVSLLNGNAKMAADSHDIVRYALEHRDQNQVSEATSKRLQGQGGVLYQMMIESYLQTTQYKKAQAAFDKLNTLYPKEVMNPLRLANILTAQELFDDATEQLNRYFESKSTRGGAAPYKLLIEINRQKIKDTTEANKASALTLQGILLEQHDNHLLAFTLAELFANNADDVDDYTAATRKIYRQFLPTHASSVGYRNLLDNLLQEVTAEASVTDSQAMEIAWILGSFYAREKSFRSLPDNFTNQFKQHPELLRQLVKVTTAYAQQNEIPAATPLELKSFPGHTAAAIALLFALLEDWDQADTLFQVAINAAPNLTGQFYETWGLQAYSQNHIERAAELFNQAIKSDFVKQKTTFHFFLAGAAYTLEDETAAVHNAKLASELGATNPRLSTRLPWILYRSGHYEEAERLYGDLVNKFGKQTSNPAVAQVVQESKMILSNICHHLEKHTAAVEWLEQVLDDDPQHIGTLNDLGYLWADQNEHLVRAKNMLEAAVQAQPENKSYRDSLGWAYYRLGDFQRARIELEKAAAGDSPDGVILDHLGDTFQQLGNVKRARELWQQAIEQFDPQRDAKLRKAAQDKLNKPTTTD